MTLLTRKSLRFPGLLRIPDPIFSIPDTGSRINKIPEVFLIQKTVSKFSKISSEVFIPDLDFFSQKSIGYWIRIRNTALVDVFSRILQWILFLGPQNNYVLTVCPDEKLVTYHYQKQIIQEKTTCKDQLYTLPAAVLKFGPVVVAAGSAG